MKPASIDVRENLLARTLRYAVDRIPFYKNLPRLRKKRPPLRLSDFPIVDKDFVTANLAQFVAFDRFPDYVISSGGTTHGAPNITFRVLEEYEAAHSYLTGIRPGQYPALDSINEFTIDIFFNTNGYCWRKPPGWPILSIALEQPAHAELIKSLLQDGLRVNERTIPARRIQSQNGPLRTLTGYFWAQGFSPADLGVASVYGYGSHTSRVWRNRLREFWGCEVLTSYGLMELGVGNAMQCGHCGAYHYRTAWPEFLALDRSGPVEEGDALLVLTSLLPFIYVQPRIRYLTGDIVRISGRCEVTNQLGFDFRGRTSSSAVVRLGQHSEVLLSEVDVIEVLDQLPDINCRAHSSELQLWYDSDLPHPPFRMGFPRFKVNPPESGGGLVTIAIEVSFDPILHSARSAGLRDQILSNLFLELPQLREKLLVSETHIEIELIHAGSLAIRTKSTA